MTAEPLTTHAAYLDRLEAHGRLRALQPRCGVDFASNDYLGLSSSGLLAEAAQEALARGVPIGSGGSRLLRGNDAEHEALEAEAAALFGVEAALFFSSGFAANATLLSTLPQRGDVILHDALVHASAHEGMRMAHAKKQSIRHNDVQAFADALAGWRASGGSGTPWIVVESLYSMDGDQAPLTELAALAGQYGAMLIVDEAHATGLFGEQGRGLAATLDGRANVITLRTFGKALGCEGAILCGPRLMRDFIINRGRGFIFSTAPSPLMAAIARRALAITVGADDRREALWQRVKVAEARLAPLGIAATASQIIPVMIGDDSRTMQIAARLQRAGYDIRGIRPPTVPEGTSRLRLSLTLNAGVNDVEALAAQLSEVLG
jgi:8-amino-7-oxononanoate synthase